MIRTKTAAAATQRKLPTFNTEAIARAEAAVETLSVEFEDWMAEELAKLVGARQQAKAAEWDEPSLRRVFEIAHEIKGVGATYNYPLATLIAKSLCTLLESAERQEKARSKPALIDAHVDAIRAVVAGRVRVSNHGIGGELLGELERQVDELTGDLA